MKYVRTTTASRREAKRTRFVNVSRQYAPDVVNGQFLGFKPLPGTTYEKGRNQSKRDNRQADIRQRVAARVARN